MSHPNRPFRFPRRPWPCSAAPADSRTAYARALVPVLLTLLTGCAAGARLQLSAAHSLNALSDSLRVATLEYHGQTQAQDAGRRALAIGAFIDRVHADHEDPQLTTQHAAAFTAALDRLQDDAEVETVRFHAAVDNLNAIKEVAAGLRKYAVDSLTLDDELKRYVTDLFTLVAEPNTNQTQVPRDVPPTSPGTQSPPNAFGESSPSPSVPAED